MPPLGKRTAKKKLKWKAAPEALVRTFGDAMQVFPDVAIRKMFGFPAAFVKGNMLGGLFQDSMMLRLSEADRARIRAEASARPFEPMPGRVMREYMVVPETILASPAELTTWVGCAVAYTRSLPAKPAKGTKPGRPARREPGPKRR